MAHHLHPVPTFWTCIRFRTSLQPMRGRAVTTFDVGGMPTDDSEPQVARMRTIRREGGEWLPGPEPLPAAMPAAMLEAVWVERWSEERQTVCAGPESPTLRKHVRYRPRPCGPGGARTQRRRPPR